MVTAELINYLKGQIASGQTSETIRTTLIGHGWSKPDIAEAFSQIGVAQSNQSQVVSSKKRFSWFIVILTALVIAAVSFVAFIKLTKSSEYGLLDKKSVLNNGLFTYISQKSNFSIQYPQDWPLTKIPADCGPCVERFVFAPAFDVYKQDPEKSYIPSDAYAFINILKINLYKSFEQKDNSLKISEARDKDVTNIQYLTIAGERAISYTFTDKLNKLNNPRILKEYWMLHNGYEYTFIPYESEPYKVNPSDYISKFNNTLSSFQFTK